MLTWWLHGGRAFSCSLGGSMVGSTLHSTETDQISIINSRGLGNVVFLFKKTMMQRARACQTKTIKLLQIICASGSITNDMKSYILKILSYNNECIECPNDLKWETCPTEVGKNITAIAWYPRRDKITSKTVQLNQCLIHHCYKLSLHKSSIHKIVF